ncbi:MAG: hypothetical protein K0S65_1602 [Labilithrix sp.]|nr:hypothetical protein [Labilithrix sp.]
MKACALWTFAAGVLLRVAAGCGGDGTTPAAADGTPSNEDGGRSADASTADARTEGGATPNDDEPLGCNSSDVIVCDGFDAPSIDPARWEEEKQNGAVSIDDAHSFRGGRSLHTTIDAGGGRAMLRAKQRATVTGQKVWGRSHMFVPGSAAASLTSHSNVVAFGGKNARGATAVHAVAIGASAFFGLYFQDEPQIDESSFVLHPDIPTTKVPLDRWFCLEWELDGVANAFRLYLDGDLIPSSVIEGRDPPAEADVIVGAEFDLAEAWLDEVVVAKRRAGCLR